MNVQTMFSHLMTPITNGELWRRNISSVVHLRRLPLYFFLFLLWSLCVLAVAPPSSAGSPFNVEASKNYNLICDDVRRNINASPPRSSRAGPNLTTRCLSFGGSEGAPGATGGSTGTGTLLAPSAIQARLRKLKEDGNEVEIGGPAGASADGTVPLGRGINVFAAPGYERLNKHNNPYEDGYRSDVARLTIGADYKMKDWLVGGIALTYGSHDGNYDDGKGFTNHAYGVSFYSSVLPSERIFIDIVGGYTFYDFNEEFVRRLFNDALTPPPLVFRGTVHTDRSGHGINGGILAGYDAPFSNITIGPRVGFNASYIHYDDYREQGNTGLELRYESESESSLQSSLGAAASIALSTSFGVLLPQIEAAWVHEFADDRRSQEARYVEAPPDSPSFQYDSEAPDRNFGVIGVALTAVLPNGLQPFTAFRAIVGNDNYNSYAVSAGLRLEL
ncbi:MAG: autotransporter outer membrane beta-barrel domain-containing protein [Defluviicoccus sp.]